MHHQVTSYGDDRQVAAAGARHIVESARRAIDTGGSFTIAVSGGATPWAMFTELATLDLDWGRTVFYQVDERCAPAGDPDRNLTHLRACLEGVGANIEPMPVEETDLESAARRYGASLPGHFDLIHLGLGVDGHTASLVPGDPVLEITDEPVALTGPYAGHRRMTLTFPTLSRATELLWLVTGTEKRVALAKLLAGDESIPAGRVRAERSTVITDRAAH